MDRTRLLVDRLSSPPYNPRLPACSCDNERTLEFFEDRYE